MDEGRRDDDADDADAPRHQRLAEPASRRYAPATGVVGAAAAAYANGEDSSAAGDDFLIEST